MWHSCMSALTRQYNFETICRCHYGPFSYCKCSSFNTGHIVNAIKLINTKSTDKSIIYHSLSSCAPLFSRLENYCCLSIKVSRFAEIFCSTQKHRCMTIMAAGVHYTRYFRFVRDTRLFGDWECIHVSS